jgi:hypothetical protein
MQHIRYAKEFRVSTDNTANKCGSVSAYGYKHLRMPEKALDLYNMNAATILSCVFRRHSAQIPAAQCKGFSLRYDGYKLPCPRLG